MARWLLCCRNRIRNHIRNHIALARVGRGRHGTPSLTGDLEGALEEWRSSALPFPLTDDVRFHRRIADLKVIYPWSKKKDKLYGRYTLYQTHMPRLKQGSAGEYTRATREHFISVARSVIDPLLFDLREKNDMTNDDMERWAAYRYLVTLNGKAVSNSIQQLLTLGSLLFVEDNGYETWFSGALRKHEHFIPIWQKEGHPEDIAAALAWARQNQARANRESRYPST